MTNSCECASWSDLWQVPLGYETIPDEWYSPRFTILLRRTPWLELVQCPQCGQHWYAGIDTEDDSYYFCRLSEQAAEAARKGDWPAVFDDIDALWPDQGWLDAFGFLSLEDWQKRNAQDT